MKKLYFIAALFLLLGSLFLAPSTTVEGAPSYTDDQLCTAVFPYSYESSESISSNGYLEQTFVPTQNRMHYLFLSIFVFNATEAGTVNISIREYDGSEIYSTSVNVNPTMNDVGATFTIDFWDQGQPYDVPLTPGDTYRIRLTSSNPFAGAYWPFRFSNPEGSCDPNGQAYKGPAVQNYDFDFTTRGYNLALPLYRFWSDTYKGHFYTIDEAEKDYIIANYPDSVWRYEGTSFNAYISNVAGSAPVYRFWSDVYKHHFYTISATERDNIIANDPNWQYESIAYYSFTSSQPDTVSLYRFWSDAYMGHFYTSSISEKNYIIATYPTSVWRYEGVGYHVN